MRGIRRCCCSTEATNGLDTDHRNAFLRSLETHASRVPWVFSSHRVEDVPRTANRLLVLREGRVHYSGKLDAAALREAFASSYRRTAPRVPAARPIARVRRRRAPAALVELESASFYVDAKRVLRELSFAVFAGECWVVHGRNGAGKSTLLRALYGDLGAAVGGTVRRAGIEPGVPIEAWKRTTGFIAPALQSEHPRELSVLEVVASGRHASIGLNDALTAADRRAALGALDAFGLTKLAERAIAELSYGLVRRVLFARAWVKVPRLMLLDEPFAGVDTETRIALLARLDRLTAEEGCGAGDRHASPRGVAALGNPRARAGEGWHALLRPPCARRRAKLAAMIYTFGERRLETLGEYFIAPSADVIGSVRLGHDASVWFNAVLRGDNDWIVIGDGTNVQDGTVIHTDAGSPTQVGRNVTFGHAALLHNCTIGDDTLIGNRAVILDNVVIGARCVIAAGALITPNTRIRTTRW